MLGTDAEDEACLSGCSSGGRRWSWSVRAVDTDVAESLGVSQQTLRNWRRQGERDRGERDDGLTSAERGVGVGSESACGAADASLRRGDRRSSPRL